MVSESSLHSAMHSLYDLSLDNRAWADGLHSVSRVFAPSARVQIHVFNPGTIVEVDGLAARLGTDAVTRLAGPDVFSKLAHPETWIQTPSLGTEILAVDIEFAGRRSVALVENAAVLTENELAAVELLLHHWEASVLIRELLILFPDTAVPRDGLLVLMRMLRDESTEPLNQDYTRVWRGLMDGSWSLVELNRNESRWQFIVKENPSGYEDPRALSPRESQVLHGASRGETNKVIAHDLALEESTVGSYLKRALGKLQLVNRVELVSLRAAIVAYEERTHVSATTVREQSFSVLSAIERIDGFESKTIVANLRTLVKRLE